MGDQSFLSYYTRLFKEVGLQLVHTARAELGSTVLVALSTYLISHTRDASAWTSLKYTLESCGYVLSGWSVFHLVRAPWRLSDKTALALPAIVPIEQEVQDLSTAILDFIYSRAIAAPQRPTLPPYEHAGAPIMMRNMVPYDAQMTVVNDYEADTRGIFKYKFSQKTEKAIQKLRGCGLSDPVLEEFTPNLYSSLLIGSEDIKKLGEKLREQAVKLERTENVSQKLLN